jgi:hypothetical protein
MQNWGKSRAGLNSLGNQCGLGGVPTGLTGSAASHCTHSHTHSHTHT